MNAYEQIMTAADIDGWDTAQDVKTRTITCRRGAVVFVVTMTRAGSVSRVSRVCRVYRVVDNATTDVMRPRDGGKLATVLGWLCEADDIDSPINQRPCPVCGQPQVRTNSTLKWWHEVNGMKRCPLPAPDPATAVTY